MSKILLAAAAIAALAGPAKAEWYDLSAADMQQSCHAVIHPEDQLAEEGRADGIGDICVFAVADYLMDNGILAMDAPDSVGIQVTRCGAELVLNHPTEATPVSVILAAEFIGACQPATM